MKSKTLSLAPSSDSSPKWRPWGIEKVSSSSCCRYMAPNTGFVTRQFFPRPFKFLESSAWSNSLNLSSHYWGRFCFVAMSTSAVAAVAEPVGRGSPNPDSHLHTHRLPAGYSPIPAASKNPKTFSPNTVWTYSAIRNQNSVFHKLQLFGEKDIFAFAHLWICSSSAS